jgi:hypothetical protein
MRTVSRSEVSLIAIVPESECRTPTLIVSLVGAIGLAAGALLDVAAFVSSAGLGGSSLLQPKVVNCAHATSTLSHFRMTGLPSDAASLRVRAESVMCLVSNACRDDKL